MQVARLILTGPHMPAICLLAMTLGATDTALAQNCVNPPEGLVSWWRGEGDASDSVDSNPGTLDNGATFATGKVGQAFSFDGVDDQINIPHAPNIFFSNSEAFTVEAWFLAKSEVTSYFVLKNAAYGVRWEGSSSPLLFYNGNNHFSTQSTWQTNQWYHVALVDDGMNSVKLYVDGFLDKSDDGPLWNPNRFEAHRTTGEFFLLQVGRSGTTGFFNGLVDEVSVYNRALSAGEIQAIFQADAIGKCICGNGTIDLGEECDDGNNANGDCCSSTCTFESFGSPCTDNNTCTTSDQCELGVCVPGACDVGRLCGVTCAFNLTCQETGGACKCAG